MANLNLILPILIDHFELISKNKALDIHHKLVQTVTALTNAARAEERLLSVSFGGHISSDLFGGSCLHELNLKI